MLATERQNYIVTKIKEEGGVEVEKLAKELDVSLMTIRRDLQHLSEEGWIERCHGGAIAKKEVPYTKKISAQGDEKKQIAKKALSYINDGDCIFLDAGTTNLYLAKELKKLDNLTIVTNDLEIGHYVNKLNCEMIICGGWIQKDTSCMMGMLTENTLRELKIDAAFIGAASIDEEFEVLTPTEEKVAYKRLAIANSCYSYLLVDSSKFNRKAMRRINNMGDYTGVITTYQFEKEELELIEKKKIHIINA